MNAPAARPCTSRTSGSSGCAFDLADGPNNHPDLVKCWACPRFVRIDGFTGESDYQGLQLCHTPGIGLEADRPGDRSSRQRASDEPDPPREPLACSGETRYEFDQVYVFGGGRYGLDQAVGCRVGHEPVWHCESDGRQFVPAAAEPSKARATTPYAATTCGGRARRTTLPGRSLSGFRLAATSCRRAAQGRPTGPPDTARPQAFGVTRPSDVERGIAPGGLVAEEPLQPRRCCGRFSLKRRKDRTWLAPQSGARSRSPH